MGIDPSRCRNNFASAVGHNLTGLSKLTSVGDSSRAPEESHYVGPVSPNRSSKRMTPSSFKVVTPSSLKILGKTDSLNSLGGFNLREGTSAGGSFSDGSDSEEWYRADRITGRQGLKREGGRGKEVGPSPVTDSGSCVGRSRH